MDRGQGKPHGDRDAFLLSRPPSAPAALHGAASRSPLETGFQGEGKRQLSCLLGSWKLGFCEKSCEVIIPRVKTCPHEEAQLGLPGVASPTMPRKAARRPPIVAGARRLLAAATWGLAVACLVPSTDLQGQSSAPATGSRVTVETEPPPPRSDPAPTTIPAPQAAAEPTPEESIQPGRAPSAAFPELSPTQRQERLMRLFDRYVRATGGHLAIRSIEALIGTGFYIRENRRWPMQWVRRSPDLARVRVEQTTGVYALVYDGQRSWERLPNWPQFRPMAAQEAAEFAHFIALISPFYQAMQSDVRPRYLREVNWEGRPAELVEMSVYGGSTWQLYFPVTTALPAAAILITDTEASQPLSVIRFDQYRPVQGVQLPHRISFQREGWDIFAYEVTDFEINRGVFRNVFEVDDRE